MFITSKSTATTILGGIINSGTQKFDNKSYFPNNFPDNYSDNSDTNAQNRMNYRLMYFRQKIKLS